jgi:hypothetical protein
MNHWPAFHPAIIWFEHGQCSNAAEDNSGGHALRGHLQRPSNPTGKSNRNRHRTIKVTAAANPANITTAAPPPPPSSVILRFLAVHRHIKRLAATGSFVLVWTRLTVV